MDILLDTHTFIWYIEGNPKLTEKAREALEMSADKVYLSIISLWEIAIKTGKNQLTLQNQFDDLLDVLNSLQIEILSITFADTKIYKNLPLHHGDPFDRMIIAQAISNNLTIVGCDQSFNNYPIQILWK
ncbi:MAG: type II toxin-antitoxin system VapC family toxin [Pseudanabaena sp. ELA645]|jgi:PIN domain nuclease of toxin-antitoxin system